MQIDARRQVLESRFTPWTPMTLDERLDRCAAEYAERPLVVTDEVTWTYAEVRDLSVRLADGLAALGIGPEHRVGILMTNYAEFVPAKFAAARTGAISVPLNFRYRAEELAYVLRQSECTALITMTGFDGMDYLAMLDEIAPGWESGGGEALPDLRQVIVLSTDGRERDGAMTLDQLARLGDANAGASAGGRRQPGDLGDMLYTSGTTGSPKGVLVTHDAVQRTAYGTALTRAFQDGRRVLFSLPCYHMFGYVEGLLSTMLVGGAVIMQTRFDPGEYLRAIEQHRADDMLCVPTMTVALLEHPDRATRDLSSLNALLSGAAPAPAWLYERCRDDLGVSELCTGYGMTECGGAMTLTLPEDPIEQHVATVGRPKLAGAAGIPARDGALVEYAVADPISGERLPDDAEGELISRGPTMMKAFWGKPEETARTLRGEWVHSGDLGRITPDGYVQVTGRSKELYKSGGELVMPKEIEELLCAHDGISQAFAIGVPDDRWGEIGLVWIVRAPGSTVTEQEVIALCKDNLARFKVPKRVLFARPEELPMTPTGKVQKFRLVRQAQELLEHAAT
ncbi:AMP-binding protein [Conexibacter sp. JD483]|uniref:class I adenylate-forming enzyme family protein n=1 Tax=unclassified Conexibacter TaxID=2627773 RepID=UPI002724C798|nr:MULTISPECIES: AMP-binding protein [unclassified Conexibacter]MDO8187730.1 AMP-binding protein [Conexibacter sp. CPCC 205706]MDO8200233.1 AMP-binding protein [Conexibacter sp. CPCC 205762]MDR9369409.1 AMP-binding protein [Conexibacter sp. JD483]